MKKLNWLFLVVFSNLALLIHGQAVNKTKFFTDESIIDITLTTDIRKMQNEKGVDVFQPATIVSRFPDSTIIEETIQVAPRGHFRRENCEIPPIMMIFNTPGSPRHMSLGKLKLVIGCGSRGNDEQLLIKEYLVYKLYNVLEEKSFRVRLVRVNYRDTRNKVKAFSQYAFLIEDDNELAARTGCIKLAKGQFHTESTDRQLMTKVAVFQYMISNGDWSVPNTHNIKLIFDKKNTAFPPYVVPYDFDHSGFVNAGYALPNELLGTESVTERVYRGFPRTMDELQKTFQVFHSNKSKMYALINGSPQLQSRTKKELIDYLDDFYSTINDRKRVQNVFIDNARKQ